MKTKHDGDCTIYSALVNGNPEDGICTCGYGLQRKGEGNFSEMYSKELLQKLEEKNGLIKLIKKELKPANLRNKEP